jgi:hypothetical protein
MSYLFTCPHCQTKTLVDDQYSGQSGRCVTCAAPIQLPDFAPAGTASGRPLGGAPATGRGTPIGPLGRRLIAAAVCLVLIACAGIVVLRYGSPAMSGMQSARQRGQAIRNIERIAAALNAYAADHGNYPLPQTIGPDGKPMHSWRVAILPYLGEQTLYDQYDMSQPWDASTNYTLAQRVPSVYRPIGISMHGNEAGYSLVVGPGTLFPPAPSGGYRALGPRDVNDDPGQTLLIVQSVPASNSFMSWTQPGDLDASLMQGFIGGTPGREIGGALPDGAIVATVDGRGHFLSDATPSQTVMALITISGGEPLSDDVLDR